VLVYMPTSRQRQPVTHVLWLGSRYNFTDINCPRRQLCTRPRLCHCQSVGDHVATN